MDICFCCLLLKKQDLMCQTAYRTFSPFAPSGNTKYSHSTFIQISPKRDQNEGGSKTSSG